MRVVSYLRVSTDKQADEGLGLDVQRAAVKKWARTEGHRIVGEFVDQGVSGSNGIESRDALPDALGLLRDGSATGLIVYRLDRLARDLVLQEQLLAEVRRLGAEVFSTSAGESAYLVDDPDDPSRRLIRQILGAVNEYERGMIRLRLRSGRARKAHVGGYAYGGPPFGFEASNGELVAVPEEQSVIDEVVALHGDGKSLRTIADDLNQRGVPARRGRWHPSTVARIVRRASSRNESLPNSAD